EDGALAAVLVEAGAPSGDACADARWFGENLAACALTGAQVPIRCDRPDTDTDVHSDPPDTEIDAGVCFEGPPSTAPLCPDGACPTHAAVCGTEPTDLQASRCALPGRGSWDLLTWTDAGEVHTALFGVGGALIALGVDPVD